MSKKIRFFFHFLLKTIVICQGRNGRAESASAESSRRRIVSAPNGLGAESSQRRNVSAPNRLSAESAAPKRPRRKVSLPNIGQTKKISNPLKSRAENIEKVAYFHPFFMATLVLSCSGFERKRGINLSVSTLQFIQ